MNPKPFLIILGVSCGLLILCAVVNGVLESKFQAGMDQLGPQWESAMKVLGFVLFLLICVAFIPLFLRLFIAMQIRIGNGEFAPIKWLAEHERQAVYASWGAMAAGLAIALPAAIRDGFFK